MNNLERKISHLNQWEVKNSIFFLPRLIVSLTPLCRILPYFLMHRHDEKGICKDARGASKRQDIHDVWGIPLFPFHRHQKFQLLIKLTLLRTLPKSWTLKHSLNAS